MADLGHTQQVMLRVGPFEVDGLRDWLRTAVGYIGLIEVGEPILSRVTERLQGRIPHAGLRLWGKTATRMLGLHIHASGIENIDPSRVYVVTPLHEGLIDPLLITRLPLRTRYLVRDELFDWPHLGRFLRSSGQIEVPTNTADLDLGALMSQAKAVTALGESLVAFPQGSILGIEVAFRRGPFVLADRLALPLLPVVISGTHRVWEHPYRPTLRYRQHVSMKVLPPLPVGSARSLLGSIESEMKSIALSAQSAPARRFDPAKDGYWDGYDYEIDSRFPEVAAAIKAHRQQRALRPQR